ncbi:hypothetical protein, partial [Roseobacter sp.]|uniref:hypothetical protein n=1 Tax=Roseobacter sp. TaxID=1907202 RepID=UPI003858DC6E
MEHAAVLTLAGLCLGIALTGLLAAVLRQSEPYERLSLGLVYLAFIGMIALPLVRTLAEGVLINYMPLLLVMLLALPPAFYHYVAARTVIGSPAPVRSQVPWRDLVLPLIGAVVCIGYWLLPARAKEVMFISGDLPPGVWPAVLALSTFALILIWLIASFAYLVAVLRRLTAYRAHVRQLYTDVEKRDLRWVDGMMVLLVLIWVVGAFSLAEDNLFGGNLIVQELFLALNAGGLLCLTIFAPITQPDAILAVEEVEPDPKYARSALSDDQAATLAAPHDAKTRKDTRELDPSLSVPTQTHQVGA